MTQAEVSKLERRTNPQLETLRRFIHATGGQLEITAVYGDIAVPLALADVEATPSTLATPFRTPPSRKRRPARDTT